MGANLNKVVISEVDEASLDSPFRGSDDDAIAQISPETKVANSTGNVTPPLQQHASTSVEHQSHEPSSISPNGYLASQAAFWQRNGVSTGQYDDHIRVVTASDMSIGGGFIAPTETQYTNVDDSGVIDPGIRFNESGPLRNSFGLSVMNVSQPSLSLM